MEYWTFSAGFSYVIVCIWIIFKKEIYPEPSCILILFLFYYQGTLIHWHSKYQKLDRQTLKDFLLREEVMKGAVVAQKLLFYAPSKRWEELLGGGIFKLPQVICIKFTAGESFPAEMEQIPLSSVLQQGPRTPIVAGCCTVVHGLSSGSCHGSLWVTKIDYGKRRKSFKTCPNHSVQNQRSGVSFLSLFSQEVQILPSSSTWPPFSSTFFSAEQQLHQERSASRRLKFSLSASTWEVT